MLHLLKQLMNSAKLHKLLLNKKGEALKVALSQAEGVATLSGGRERGRGESGSGRGRVFEFYLQHFPR